MKFIGGSLHGEEVPEDLDLNQLMRSDWRSPNDEANEAYVIRWHSDADGVRRKFLVLATVTKSQLDGFVAESIP